MFSRGNREGGHRRATQGTSCLDQGAIDPGKVHPRPVPRREKRKGKDPANANASRKEVYVVLEKEVSLGRRRVREAGRQAGRKVVRGVSAWSVEDQGDGRGAP